MSARSSTATTWCCVDPGGTTPLEPPRCAPRTRCGAHRSIKRRRGLKAPRGPLDVGASLRRYSPYGGLPPDLVVVVGAGGAAAAVLQPVEQAAAGPRRAL